MVELTSFNAKARAIGHSLMITIDKRVCEFEGIKESDLVKVYIKKLDKSD